MKIEKYTYKPSPKRRGKAILNYYGTPKPDNENKEVIRFPRCGALNRTQSSSKIS